MDNEKQTELKWTNEWSGVPWKVGDTFELSGFGNLPDGKYVITETFTLEPSSDWDFINAKPSTEVD